MQNNNFTFKVECRCDWISGSTSSLEIALHRLSSHWTPISKRFNSAKWFHCFLCAFASNKFPVSLLFCHMSNERWHFHRIFVGFPSILRNWKVLRFHGNKSSSETQQTMSEIVSYWVFSLFFSFSFLHYSRIIYWAKRQSNLIWTTLF